MAKKFWWPKRISEQRNVISTFRASIPTAGSAVGMTPMQITSAIDLCDSLLEVYYYTENLTSTAKATTAWRNQMFYGKTTGKEMSPPPPVVPPASLNYFEGSLDMFFKLRQRIKASESYSVSAMTELGLVGTEITKPSAAGISPDLKITSAKGNKVNIRGNLEGYDALRIDYASDGGNFRNVAFLTRTPAEIEIPNDSPGVPVRGSITGQFIKANHPIGSSSPIYPIVTW